jgi:hypothetical protein
MGNLSTFRFATPIVQARRVTALTLTNNTTQSIVFDQEDYDIYNVWNGTTFTAPVAGRYKFEVNLQTLSVGTITANDMILVLSVNGSAVAANRFGARASASSASTTWHTSGCVPVISLAANDAIIFQAFINATGSTSLSIPANSTTSLLISLLP